MTVTLFWHISVTFSETKMTVTLFCHVSVTFFETSDKVFLTKINKMAVEISVERVHIL